MRIRLGIGQYFPIGINHRKAKKLGRRYVVAVGHRKAQAAGMSGPRDLFFVCGFKRGRDKLLGHHLGNCSNGHSRGDLSGGFASHAVRDDVQPYLRLNRLEVLSEIQRKDAILVEFPNEAYIREMARLQHDRKIQILQAGAQLGSALKALNGGLGQRTTQQPFKVGHYRCDRIKARSISGSQSLAGQQELNNRSNRVDIEARIIDRAWYRHLRRGVPDARVDRRVFDPGCDPSCPVESDKPYLIVMIEEDAVRLESVINPTLLVKLLGEGAELLRDPPNLFFTELIEMSKRLRLYLIEYYIDLVILNAAFLRFQYAESLERGSSLFEQLFHSGLRYPGLIRSVFTQDSGKRIAQRERSLKDRI